MKKTYFEFVDDLGQLETAVGSLNKFMIKNNIKASDIIETKYTSIAVEMIGKTMIKSSILIKLLLPLEEKK